MIFALILLQTAVSCFLLICTKPWRAINRFLEDCYGPLKSIASAEDELVQAKNVFRIQLALFLSLIKMCLLTLFCLLPFSVYFLFDQAGLAQQYNDAFLNWQFQLMTLGLMMVLSLAYVRFAPKGGTREQYSPVARLLILLGWASVRMQLKRSFAFHAAQKKSVAAAQTKFILVTGLARSGTTILFRNLSGQPFATSLLYRNLPFLFHVKWNAAVHWIVNHQSELVERSHNDGIMINADSAEALDEMIFSRIDAELYIKRDVLSPHSSPEAREQFLQFGRNFASVDGKLAYITKNNNHILRIQDFTDEAAFTSFMMVRHPVAHAHSLYRVHQALCDRSGTSDKSFEIEFMNLLGHFEFGPNHKKFELNCVAELERYLPNDWNYWLVRWIEYYSYVLRENLIGQNVVLINYENMVKHQKVTEKYFSEFFARPVKFEEALRHEEFQKDVIGLDAELITMAEGIYKNLSTKCVIAKAMKFS